MVKIYTRTGDKGQTGLLGGQRVQKHHLRVEVYGTFDELNSFLGLAISGMSKIHFFQNQISFLREIQCKIFSLGTLFSAEKKDRTRYHLHDLELNDVLAIEVRIDELEKQLPPLKNFILPGTNELNSRWHICRTVCRRCERQLSFFASEYPDELPNYSLEYINRLSDFFFVLARFVDHQLSDQEIIWKMV